MPLTIASAGASSTWVTPRIVHRGGLKRRCDDSEKEPVQMSIFVVHDIKISLCLRSTALAFTPSGIEGRMDEILAALRAAAEPTRLRLLALCAEGEMTVSEITQVVGQSQPRVSRHLRLLCEAGLLDRLREGAWVFYRLSDRTDSRGASIARRLLDMLPADDAQIALDRQRLDDVKRARAESAAAYFRRNAERWDSMRSMYVPEVEVERALIALLPPETVSDLLDIGTGTGRMLVLYGPSVARAVGVDVSRDMLAIARANLETTGLRHCQVRHADMYRLPFADASFDAVTVHQVLHYADRPRAAIAEAARVLKPGGRIVIADFAPHAVESLREEHAHRRLGFSDDEVEEWCDSAGLSLAAERILPGAPLTVALWLAEKPTLPPAAAKRSETVEVGR
jgi:ArsR family transcriptional regulator